MKRASLRVLVGLVVMLSLAAAAFAEEGERPEGGRRRQRRPGMGERGKHRPDMGRPGGQHERFQRHLRNRMMIMQKLRNTEEGKAEMERLKNTMKELAEERKKLHEAIRDEIKGGKTPKEAFQAHADDLKALMKKGALLRIEHQEKILSIARKYVDKFVDGMHDKMKERARNRMQQMRRRRGGKDGEGGDGDRPPHPRFRARRGGKDGEGDDGDRPPRPRFRARRGGEGGDEDRRRPPRRRPPRRRRRRPDDDGPPDDAPGDDE